MHACVHESVFVPHALVVVVVGPSELFGGIMASHR